MPEFKFDGRDLDNSDVIKILKQAHKGGSSLEAQSFTETRLVEANKARLKHLKQHKRTID